MYVKKVRVQNFLIHNDKEITLDSGVNTITGPNGSGKTSIVEAIYTALRGSSFKSGDDKIVNDQNVWYRIDIELSDGTNRTVKFVNQKDSKKKTFEIDDKINLRIPTAKKYPVILFEPTDMQLISGSPSRRRQYFDKTLEMIDGQYGTILRRYERVLQQRNKLLKENIDPDNIFAWNVALADYGSQIIDHRQKIIDYFNENINKVYKDISEANDEIFIKYNTSNEIASKEYLLKKLENNIDKDVILGYTTTGPHRHDIDFIFNQSKANATASRGETRTIVLALKFITDKMLKDRMSIDPIVILDDVFSELDSKRQQLTLNFFSNSQIICTSTSVPENIGNVTKIVI